MSTTPIVQFGTSRFLQAHVDLFLSEAEDALGPVTVVQTTGDAERARRLNALSDGYDVRLRGVTDGLMVDETRRVTSIARTFALTGSRAEVERILAEEAEAVVSNTGDSGFRPQPADQRGDFEAMSFPAKLARLLRPRFEAGAKPIQVMPAELIQNNGSELRRLVLATVPAGLYRDWLAEEVVWVNSLVDRIVSEPLEPAGAVAEPYALWAIEDRPRLIRPCTHPDVEIVPDLGPIERRKLFVLNLGHTWMVSRWLARGRSGATYVRDVMADEEWSNALRALYAEEVVPAFAAAGEREGIDEYVATTLDRFANPFLDHKLEDIAQNHDAKLERRIAAFLEWAAENGDTAPKPMLRQALNGAA